MEFEELIKKKKKKKNPLIQGGPEKTEQDTSNNMWMQ